MSLSKERQQYHLTPSGWIEGTFIGDIFGGKEEKPIPNDRVLTIECLDEIPSGHKPITSIYSDSIVWQNDDSKRIDELRKKYGEKPDWYGYTAKQ